MNKKLVALATVGVLVPSAVFVPSVQAMEIQDKTKTIAYGHSVTQSEKEELKDILEITESEAVEEIIVYGEDLKTYINSNNTTANMYSSAMLTPLENSNAVILSILTPENITQVTENQYINAVITSGISGVQVDIVSTRAVSGHSALVGIYKALDEKGVELDQDRMEVATEELEVVSEITQDNQSVEGFNEEMLNKALIDIKKGLADLGNDGDLVSNEQIDSLISKALEDNGLSGIISQNQIEKLRGFAEKYVKTGAIKDSEVLAQLDSLAKDVTSKLKDAKDSLGNKINDLNEQGFFDKIKEFFASIFESIKNIFKSEETELAPTDVQVDSEEQVN